MTKIRSLLLALAVAVLSGCAAVPAPPLPTVGVPPGGKVGVLVDLSQQATHTHVGTTIFNNFVKERQLPFDLAAYTREAFASKIAKNGQVVVMLDPKSVSIADVQQLIRAKDGSYRVGEKQGAVYKRLRDELGLSAVVFVQGQPSRASMECGAGGCTERFVSTSGLFTRSVFGLTTYYAVPSFEVNAFQLEPLADYSVHEPMNGLWKARVKQFSRADRPTAKDFDNFTDAEFQPVTDWIKSYVDQMSTAVANQLVRR